MTLLMALGPRLFSHIAVEAVKMQRDDFFEMLDSRPRQTGPPATPQAENTEDVFAIPHKAAA